MLKDAPSQEALDALKTQISAIETNLATISGTVDANAAAIAQLKIQMVAVEKYKELIDANAEEIDKSMLQLQLSTKQWKTWQLQLM